MFDNIATFICRLSERLGSLSLLEPPGLLLACSGIALRFCLQLSIFLGRTDCSSENKIPYSVTGNCETESQCHEHHTLR
jgi:hypothetical protein